jgi:hypothetical protein
MSFRVSPRSSRLVKRFNTRTKAVDTEAAASAFGAIINDLQRPRFLEALNAISGVLHGTIELWSVKQSTLEAMCSVFLIEFPMTKKRTRRFCRISYSPVFTGPKRFVR